MRVDSELVTPHAKLHAGGATQRRAARTLEASFDAARATADNRRNWEFADGLAGDAAVDPSVRSVLRNRSNYEAANNPHLAGQLDSLSNDVIGPRGPTLQAQTRDERLNAALEFEFGNWARAIKLSQKLRLLRKTRAKREVLGLFIYNPLVAHAVKLDLQLIEGDQCATPDLWLRGLQRDNRYTDGIEFDSYGNPKFYHILRRHPGDTTNLIDSPIDYERVPAADVVHFFKCERPGQRRGYPETAPGLNLYSERRRYRRATVDAAELQAYFSAAIETPVGIDPPETGSDFEEIELPRRAGMTLPPGAKLAQLETNQPSTSFCDFDDALVGESARALNMPRNVATGNSSKYNYASTRADHQNYDRANEVDQDDLDLDVLAALLARFCVWANSLAGLLPASGRRLLPTAEQPRRQFKYLWFFQEREHVDPLKEANATRVRLNARTTTLAAEYAKQGKDWRDEIAQLGAEQSALAQAGLNNGDPLTGPALAAALEVLSKLRDRTIVPIAATELLTAVGVPRGLAEKMVAATPGQRSDSDADVRFKRELIIKALGDGTIADIIVNQVSLKELLTQVNVPIDPDAPEPRVPITGDNGVTLDPEGNPLDVAPAVATDPARNGKRNGRSNGTANGVAR